MGRQTVKLTHISELAKDVITEKTYGDNDFWNEPKPEDIKEKQRKGTIENAKFKAK